MDVDAALCALVKRRLSHLYFLEEGDLEDVACYFRPLEVKAGEVAWREGDPCDSVAFVVSGSLEIKKETEFEGKQVVLGIYGPGAVAGELCFADRGPREVTAVALEDTCLIVIDRDRLEEMIEAHPALGVKFLRGLLLAVSRRLRQCFQRMASIF
ncbi:MAG: hypothetical protein Kow0092_37090 [Deferrisomatales bacterium]